MGSKLDTTSIQNEITTAKKKLNDLERSEELQYNILQVDELYETADSGVLLDWQGNEPDAVV